MTKLMISGDFTIEDIHRVREYNFERRKNMTFEEEKADITEGANTMLRLIEEKRKERHLKQSSGG